MNRLKKQKKKQRVTTMLRELSFLALLLIVLSAAGKYGLQRWKTASNDEYSPISFKPETYSTNLPSMKPELDILFAGIKDHVLTSTTTSALSEQFLQNHRELKDISLVPNYLTGDVNIKLKLRKLVAEVKINNDVPALLTEDGTILDSSPENSPKLPFSIIITGSKVPDNLPWFIAQVNKNYDRFSRSPIAIKCASSEDSCIIMLNDGSVVYWGALEYTMRKIEELNHVLDVASSRNPGAFAGRLKIDLRYAVSLGRSFYRRLSRENIENIKPEVI